MEQQIREIRYFFFSQSFSDGVRITLAILIPSLLLAQFDQFQHGLAVSLGALYASMADSPGPVIHKRNGMLASTALAFTVTLVTGFARQNIWILGAEVGAFSFLFSMFVLYGNRATSVGTAGLLSMILMMDRAVPPHEVFPYGLLILAGGTWYTSISLLFFRILPYRPAQQALGECIHEMAKFCRIKADFYSLQTNLDEDYQHLIAQQAIVGDKQNAVREVLFKSRMIVQESTHAGRMLMLTFVDLIDLYEHMVTLYYDYASIRERFGHTGILDTVADLIREMADELDRIGLAVQSNRTYRNGRNWNRALTRLKRRIDELGQSDGDGSNLVLKKILISLRNLNQRLTDIPTYFSEPADGPKLRRQPIEYGRFVSRQEIDLRQLPDNLNIHSSAFRYALRVSAACLVGFAFAKAIAHGPHSYWILLTITVILKPGFGLTRQRNFERIIGTVAGGLIGVLILGLVHQTTVLFGFMVMLMVGAYSFQRINYIVMVTLMTPYILILFRFLGVGQGFGVIEERIVDTLIGSSIAILTGYLLFPSWESEQLKAHMEEVLCANTNYLQKLLDSLCGKPLTVLDYKLARKDVYVSSANLSAAFQRMISEPKNKQRHRKEVHEFVVLNHILSSNIGTIATSLREKEPRPHPPEIQRPVRRSLTVLRESTKKWFSSTPGSSSDSPTPSALAASSPAKADLNEEDRLLRGQLDFIQKISTDIAKITDAILS